MAIYVNFAGNQATFDLAEVVPLHAGKELVIELWDPDSGNNRVTIKEPDGTLPQCTWNSTDGRSGGPMGCNITFGNLVQRQPHADSNPDRQRLRL